MKEDKALTTVAAAAGGFFVFLGLRKLLLSLLNTRSTKRPITIRGGVSVRKQLERCIGTDFIVEQPYEHDLKEKSNQKFEVKKRVATIVFIDFDGITAVEKPYSTVPNRTWSVTITGPGGGYIQLSDLPTSVTGGVVGKGIEIDLAGGDDFKYSVWEAKTVLKHYGVCVVGIKVVIAISGGKTAIYSATPQTGELQLPDSFGVCLEWPDL